MDNIRVVLPSFNSSNACWIQMHRGFVSLGCLSLASALRIILIRATWDRVLLHRLVVKFRLLDRQVQISRVLNSLTLTYGKLPFREPNTGTVAGRHRLAFGSFRQNGLSGCSRSVLRSLLKLRFLALDSEGHQSLVPGALSNPVNGSIGFSRLNFFLVKF